MTITTWVGGFGNNWGATPGGVNPNWDTGFTPQKTTDVARIYFGTPDITLDGDAECLELDMQTNGGAYDGTMDGGGFKLTVAGDSAQWSTLATYVNMHVELDKATAGTILFNNAGHPCHKVSWVGGDLRLEGTSIAIAQFDGTAATGLLSLGDDVSMEAVEGEVAIFFKLNPAVTHAWDSNVLLRFNTPDGNDQTQIQCSDAALGGTIEHNGDGSASLLLLSDFTAFNFTQNSGEFDFGSFNIGAIDDGAGNGQVSWNGGTMVNATGKTAGPITANMGSNNVNFTGGTWSVDDFIGITGGDNSDTTFIAAVDNPAAGFSQNGGTLTNCTINVPPTAAAYNIADCTVTGCTGADRTIDATFGGIDGGGNTNILFPDSVITWDGSADSNISNIENWDLFLEPTSTHDVVFNSAAPGDVGPGNLYYFNVDFTDFDKAFFGSLNSYGDTFLSPDMTSGDFSIEQVEGGTLTSNGRSFNFLQMDANAGLFIHDALVVGNVGNNGSGGIYPGSNFNFIMDENPATCVLLEGDEDGFYFDTGSGTISWGAGAKFIFTGPGNFTYCDLGMFEGLLVPPVEVSGGVMLYTYGHGIMESLSIIDGGLYMDGEVYETSGPMTLAGGNLGDFEVDDMVGSTLKAGGAMDISGIALVTNGNLDGDGSKTIHDATVSNMTSNNAVDCTDGCIDGGGNDANFDFGEVVTAPSVTSVDGVTPNGSYGTGSTIDISVAWTESVEVTGTPRILMDVSATRYANYISGSGSSTLIFRYTVQAGDDSPDLDYVGSDSLQLNGGTILATDDDEVAVLTLPNPGAAGSLSANADIVIDSLAPFVQNVTSAHADGSFGVGEVIDVTVQFNEPVFVTGTPKLTLELKPARQAAYLSGSGSNVLTFRLTVRSPDNTTDLDYRSINSLALNGGTIKDGISHDAILTLPTPGAAGSLGANKAIVILTPGKTAGVGAGRGFGPSWGFGL